jgi:excinuclease ABC subunit B
MFRLNADYEPAGDQPKAIEGLVESVRAGNKFSTLLGVTGSGKTFTVANLIAREQRPTLVIAHNKTLAAQLCNEYRSFFPDAAVEFFISYYDYYQPEAYIPFSDTYIEKDASINKEIERLRHAATQALLTRRDAIVVASVSCIYGLGSPEDYERSCLNIETGGDMDREELIDRLIEMQFERAEDAPESGQFRVRGGSIEVIPSESENVVKLDFFGDSLERITVIDSVTGEAIQSPPGVMFFPATHYVLLPERVDGVLKGIESELGERLAELRAEGKEMESNRLWERTMYDVEMIREMGYCHGIENYSRHFDGRKPGEPPHTLIDYFPDDALVVIDESHVTIPQLRAMSNGDRSRKKSLVDYGFRLPSAFDNRPLSFEEFMGRAPQIVFTSATPSRFEMEQSGRIVEQIIRPTGLIDPVVERRGSSGQMAALLEEIKTVTDRGERVLVTTLTKKMSEELTEYLLEKNVRARYMHSDIETLDRIQIIYDLRRGVFDVLVGINLLREGLDLPEVSLVAILDADKEGFLRSDVTMIQTMGRAARNINGRVILFGDKDTDSMKRAMRETERRREKQIEHNRRYNIEPKSIHKEVQEQFATASYKVGGRRGEAVGKQLELKSIPELTLHLAELEKKMWAAADALDFETAAACRDQISLIKKKKKAKEAY